MPTMAIGSWPAPLGWPPSAGLAGRGSRRSPASAATARRSSAVLIDAAAPSMAELGEQQRLGLVLGERRRARSRSASTAGAVAVGVGAGAAPSAPAERRLRRPRLEQVVDERVAGRVVEQQRRRLRAGRARRRRRCAARPPSASRARARWNGWRGAIDAVAGRPSTLRACSATNAVIARRRRRPGDGGGPRSASDAPAPAGAAGAAAAAPRARPLVERPPVEARRRRAWATPSPAARPSARRTRPAPASADSGQHPAPRHPRRGPRRRCAPSCPTRSHGAPADARPGRPAAAGRRRTRRGTRWRRRSSAWPGAPRTVDADEHEHEQVERRDRAVSSWRCQAPASFGRQHRARTRPTSGASSTASSVTPAAWTMPRSGGIVGVDLGEHPGHVGPVGDVGRGAARRRRRAARSCTDGRRRPGRRAHARPTQGEVAGALLDEVAGERAARCRRGRR